MKTEPNDLVDKHIKSLDKSADPYGVFKKEGGLTKREYFAGLAFQAMITKVPLHGKMGIKVTQAEIEAVHKYVCETSLIYADALILELNKDKSK